MADPTPLDNLLVLVKQSLAIVSTATARDTELTALINAGIQDLKRQGIEVDDQYDNDLINATIIMFVKANFGMVDDRQKEYARKTYNLLCQNLGLSDEFKESGLIDD